MRLDNRVCGSDRFPRWMADGRVSGTRRVGSESPVREEKGGEVRSKTGKRPDGVVAVVVALWGSIVELCTIALL